MVAFVTDIGGMDVPAGDAVLSWPSKLAIVGSLHTKSAVRLASEAPNEWCILPSI